MASFVLIHGGGHRSWHWHLLRPLLEQLGHTTLAPEVAMDDPDSRASDWADVIFESMSTLAGREDVILVGHSVAGLAVPIVASRVSLRRLILLCANVPEPGRAFTDRVREDPDAITPPPLMVDARGRFTFTWEVAREFFYADCDEAVARAAWTHLIPSAAKSAQDETCPLTAWPDVLTSSILCTEDRIVGPSWSRRVSLAQLGAPAIELPGSHSPFLSRPVELASVLHRLADVSCTSKSRGGSIHG